MIVVGAKSSKKVPKPRPLKNPRQAAAVPPTAEPSQVRGNAVATQPPTSRPSTHRRYHAQEDPETLDVQTNPLPSQPAFPAAQMITTRPSES